VQYEWHSSLLKRAEDFCLNAVSQHGIDYGDIRSKPSEPIQCVLTRGQRTGHKEFAFQGIGQIEASLRSLLDNEAEPRARIRDQRTLAPWISVCLDAVID
jgi:hypothetical protein